MRHGQRYYHRATAWLTLIVRELEKSPKTGLEAGSIPSLMEDCRLPMKGLMIHTNQTRESTIS